jgi:hypothetical protein
LNASIADGAALSLKDLVIDADSFTFETSPFITDVEDDLGIIPVDAR